MTPLYEARTSASGPITLMNPANSDRAFVVLGEDGGEWAKLMPGSWLRVGQVTTWREEPIPRPWVVRMWRRLTRRWTAEMTPPPPGLMPGGVTSSS